MSTDPLMEFYVQPAERCAILELGLVVNVGSSKSVDLYPAYFGVSDDIFSIRLL